MTCQPIYKTLYCDSCGDSIAVPIGCQARSCSYCQRVNYNRILPRYQFALQRYNRSNGYVFATLTLKITSDSLSETYSYIKKSFSVLRRRRLFRENVAGGFYSIEVKPQYLNLYNVHIHCIWETHSHLSVVPYRHLKGGKEKISANIGTLTGQALSALWEEITGSYVVDMSPVRTDLSSFVRYAMKYICKIPHFYSAEQQDEYDSVLKGTRRISLFGTWYTMDFPKKTKLSCLVCGNGHYCVPGEFLRMISESTKQKLQNLGILLDSYG